MTNPQDWKHIQYQQLKVNLNKILQGISYALASERHDPHFLPLLTEPINNRCFCCKISGFCGRHIWCADEQFQPHYFTRSLLGAL